MPIASANIPVDSVTACAVPAGVTVVVVVTVRVAVVVVVLTVDVVSTIEALIIVAAVVENAVEVIVGEYAHAVIV
jgi:hypothetical protein